MNFSTGKFTTKQNALVFSPNTAFSASPSPLNSTAASFSSVERVKSVEGFSVTSSAKSLLYCVLPPVGRGICCGRGRGDSPTAQRLMSGPSSMPSGQAQVYLGEWSVICGAFRHRYSQPPLGRLPMLHVSGALGRENVLEIMKKICYKIQSKTRAGPNTGIKKSYLIPVFLAYLGHHVLKGKATGDQADAGEWASSVE